MFITSFRKQVYLSKLMLIRLFVLISSRIRSMVPGGEGVQV